MKKLFLVLACLAFAFPAAPQTKQKPKPKQKAATPRTVPSGLLPTGTYSNFWGSAGVPGQIAGNIPTRTTIFSTINASTYGNGSSDATSAINTQLANCSAANTSGMGAIVLLSSGTFLLNGAVTVSANCSLRGQGANLTMLNSRATGGATIYVGQIGGGPNFASAVNVTGGATAGSSSLTLASNPGFAVGQFGIIDEINDNNIVTNLGSEGAATWVSRASGTRAHAMMFQVTSVSGNVVGIFPSLYRAFANSPQASPVTLIPAAGVENLQIIANGTRNTCGSGGNSPCGALSNGMASGSNVVMNMCFGCWFYGNEGNYTDGDQIDIFFSFQSTVANNYFSNAYLHTSGQFDSGPDLISDTNLVLFQNNIMERLHVCLMEEWGVSGNVIAYNYCVGNFDSGAANVITGSIDSHGAHNEFNLLEGNVIEGTWGPDGVWGSQAYQTIFRSFARGTTLGCNPLNGRATVTCTPFGTQGGSNNGWNPFQASSAVNMTFLDKYMNEVGNVVGSNAAKNVLGYGGGLSQGGVDKTWAICPSGITTHCGPNAKSYDGAVYGYAFGYGETSDQGGGSNANCPGGGAGQTPANICNSTLPYSTLFLHGDYSLYANAVTWASGVTHTLPCSFYLSCSARPSWWATTIPFPAIGPDITGGSSDTNGYAYAIPAQSAWQKMSSGTLSGSPFTFNAATLYGQGGGGNLPSFSWSPATYAFPATAVGSSATQSFTLTNNGTLAGNVALSLTGGVGIFTITTNSCGTTLAVSASCTAVVSFSPTNTNNYTNALLQTDATNNVSASAALSGSGSSTPPPTSHSATVTWTPSTSAGVTSVNVYRALCTGTVSGNTCSTDTGSLTFAKIAAVPVPTATYVDTTVIAGTSYVYYLTAVCSGCTPTESVPGNHFTGTIPADVVPLVPPVLLSIVTAQELSVDDSQTRAAAQ